MRIVTLLAALLAAALLVGCGPAAPGEKDTEIISAKQALALVKAGAALVDAQDTLRYNRAHATGAVNVARADIVVNDPFPGLLAPPAQIEEVLGSRGIGNARLVVVYDANGNMDAARLWWTLKYYGHDNVKVASGGLDALEAAGAAVTADVPAVVPAAFKAGAPREAMRADTAAVRGQIDSPERRTVLLDVRTPSEFAEGTIPGSVSLDYVGNNFKDGTYRPVQHIRIRYLEQGIDYDDHVILYCQTSVRAAQTYLALYNAGFRDLALYDGAWVAWSADAGNPVQKLEAAVTRASASDKS
jgi:thiosulfate/3-mercaptopyruvate sulfurtransferase